MSTDEYVPSEDDVRHAYVVIESRSDVLAARAEFDRFLARVSRDAEAELDSWMARAYEAEGKLWQAEARIRHLEDTARVLVKEALNAEAERDSARGYISELETAVQSRNDVIKHRDARIKAVEDVLDQADEMGEWAITCTRLQWAIDGSAPHPGA